jgi:hypothetical protein
MVNPESILSSQMMREQVFYCMSNLPIGCGRAPPLGKLFEEKLLQKQR